MEGRDLGQEALELIQSYNPDLVVLDLMLPDIHGHQVLEDNKEDLKIKKIKFVVCTNLDTSDERKTCIDLGASDYLVKADLP